MPFHLVISDIDGTILTSRRLLTQITIETISRLYHEKGIRFALASGRGLAGIKPTAEALGIPVFILPCNGAEIYDEAQKLISRKTLVYEDALRMKKAVHAFNPQIETIVYAGTDWVADQMTDIVKGECNVIPTAPVLGDFETVVPKDTPILKVISIGTPETTSALAEYLRPLFPQYDFYKSQNYILESTAKGANKADGLAFLCRHCQIDVSKTIAIGDGYNDLDMLHFAGLGIAMGNAHDEVKAKADQTTLSNDENGAARALEKIFY
ncbi:MAG: HAD family phosphatase [Alphaproteobacteria bacterium]|nr:HAD family phosphatase [Alphaproteobacteria bacterium]